MHSEAGPLTCWYVNFERPPSWRPDGWDTLDLALDLVVDPDGGWRWKDEDEYAHCRRLGLVTDAEHAAVGRAREEALDLVRRRAGVFAEDPGASWRPDPAWPLPALPARRD
jgi:predicted RNA-binding protein associated with RNAse of E/G family